MRIRTHTTLTLTKKGRPQTGMAVIIMLTLLAIILLYIAYNARTLYHLGRELNLLEQKQLHNLPQIVIKTNTVKPAFGVPASAGPAR